MVPDVPDNRDTNVPRMKKVWKQNGKQKGGIFMYIKMFNIVFYFFFRLKFTYIERKKQYDIHVIFSSTLHLFESLFLQLLNFVLYFRSNSLHLLFLYLLLLLYSSLLNRVLNSVYLLLLFNVLMNLLVVLHL